MIVICKLIGRDSVKPITSLERELGYIGFGAHINNPFPRSQFFNATIFSDQVFLTYRVDPAPEGDNGGMIP